MWILKGITRKNKERVDETALKGKYAKKLDDNVKKMLRDIVDVIEELYGDEDIHFKTLQFLFLTCQTCNELLNHTVEISLDYIKEKTKRLIE